MSWVPNTKERTLIKGTQDWVKIDKLKKSGSLLGEYTEATNKITLFAPSDATYAHEFGHHLSYKFKGFMRAQNEFFRERTVGEKIINILKDVRGKKDKWAMVHKDAIYAGRIYSDGATPEVAAMGIEYLWKNPVAFATKDPEWFNMIVSQLKGIPTK